MNVRKNKFAKWELAVADLIADINGPTLPEKLRDAIKEVIPYEHLMVFGYRTQGRPLDLFNVSDTEYRKIVVQAYIATGYLLDPFYHRYINGYEDRWYRLDDVCEGTFTNSDYYKKHYRYTGILDELTFFLDLGDGLTGAVTLTREEDQGSFTDAEAEFMNLILPTIRAVVRHHWLGNDYPETATNNARNLASLQDHIQTAFQQFGRKVLTNRECEVTGYILGGYSSAAIADLMEISTGTVKIHRKNVYQKLSISSVNELFSLFLGSLTDPHLLRESNAQTDDSTL